MNLYLKNTLTQKKEIFIPLKDKEVSIYVCGVTLYDDIHIGHLKSIVAFEVMRNYFEAKDFKVKYVRNITDVDDKIIVKAQNIKTDPLDLVNSYIDKFHALLKVLGIREPDVEPRVTEYLKEIGQYITELKEKGFAYETIDGVYFDTQKNKPERYPLSKKIVSDLENKTRLEKEDHVKKHKADFALWKSDEKYGYKNAVFAKQGRPGWHIECSVMHHHTLGEKFDIHGGGRDLIFPHHENEILQSEAHNGVNPANYWIHNGMMTKNGKKLSKSEGNSIYVKDILEKYSPEAIKLFLNKGQYNQSQEYNEEELNTAQNHWDNFVSNIESYTSLNEVGYLLKQKVLNALEDDLNTPVAVSIIYQALKDLKNTHSRQLALEIVESLKILSVVKKESDLDSIFSEWSQAKNAIDIPDDILKLAEDRKSFKDLKKFDKADELRKEIEDRGWVIKDTKKGFSLLKK